MPVSSTAIRTPLPSPRRLVRSGSVLGSVARRTEEPGPPWSRGSPVSVIARLADEHVVGRDAHRALRAAGRGLAHLARSRRAPRAPGPPGSAGVRVKVVTPNVRRSAGFQPVSTFCDVRRVARAGQDLAGAQQERVLLVAIEGDLAWVPALGQFAHIEHPLRSAGWRARVDVREASSHHHRARTRRRSRPPRLRRRPRRPPAGRLRCSRRPRTPRRARPPSARWGWPRSSSATPTRPSRTCAARCRWRRTAGCAARGRGADEPVLGADAAGRRSARRWSRPSARCPRWRASRGRGCRCSGR